MRRTTLGLLIAVCVSVAAQAQDKPKIVRFEPNGPSGGPGLQGNDKNTTKVHYYYRSKADPRVAAGVWSAGKAHFPMRRMDSTEVIYILEGAVTVTDKAGRKETFRAGDAVMWPRGAEAEFDTEGIREYFVIFDREVAGTPPAPEGTPTFIKLEKDGPAGKGLTGEGRTKTYVYYKGADGGSAGIYDTEPYTMPEFREKKNAELMIFLKGNVTLSTPEGQQEHFKAGDVALMQKGVQHKWSSDAARMLWVAFDTQAAPSTAVAP